VLNLTSAALKVFLALDPCDMRKSFNGLNTLAADQLHATPARDALFVFTNKRRNRIKLLYFDEPPSSPGMSARIDMEKIQKLALVRPIEKS
jgi:transposase